MAEHRKFYNTRNINRKVYIIGLSPVQLLVLFVLGVIVLLVAFIAKVWSLMLVFPLVIWLALKIGKQNRLGNPDYFNEVMVWMSTNTTTNKRYLVDTNYVISKLRKNANRLQ